MAAVESKESAVRFTTLKDKEDNMNRRGQERREKNSCKQRVMRTW